jgi:hypothetical protein
MTLVELLVAMGLLALIIVLLVQVLVPGLRIWKHARAVADIEQQAMVAEERISRAVLSSVAGSVCSSSSPALQAIGMFSHGGTQSAAGYDSTNGNPRWREVDIFYVRPVQGVLYQTYWSGGALGHPSSPWEKSFRLTPAQLTGLCGASGHPDRKVAEKVSALSIEQVPDEERFLLKLTLTTNVPTGTKSIQRDVSLVPRMRERK